MPTGSAAFTSSVLAAFFIAASESVNFFTAVSDTLLCCSETDKELHSADFQSRLLRMGRTDLCAPHAWNDPFRFSPWPAHAAF